MRERPILFNGDMVRAVLNGSKTQTRRIMKVQPESNQFGLLRITDSTKRSDIGKYHWAEPNATGTHLRWPLFSCPFGAVGDRLWVRETWAEAGGSAPELQLYRANYPAHVPSHYENVPPAESIRWRPSIHMPRWASRITLEITGVRVERLQDISEADARAEGVHWSDGNPNEFGLPTQLVVNAKEEFAHLWRSIYGEESWQANPWVWVVEFKRVEGEA